MTDNATALVLHIWTLGASMLIDVITCPITIFGNLCECGETRKGRFIERV